MKRYTIICLIALPLALLFIKPASSAMTPSALKIYYSGGRISADLTNAPLSRVLQTIHEKTGIDYQLNADIEDLPISAAFTNLQLEEGMKKLLVRVNNAIIYGPGRQIKKVVIFNKLDQEFPDLPEAVSSANPPASGLPAPSVASPKDNGDTGFREMVPKPLPPPNGRGQPTGPSPVASNGPESGDGQDISLEGPTPLAMEPGEVSSGPVTTAQPVELANSDEHPGIPVKPISPEVPFPQ